MVWVINSGDDPLLWYLEVGERPLHQAAVFLVVVQQVVPQRLLGKNLNTKEFND
jgi:hypothetical protein